MSFPSTVTTPEFGPVATDETEACVPAMTMESKPRAPPSIVPASVPPVSMTKVSWLSGAPLRLVKPW